jgi:hypothetical protein
MRHENTPNLFGGGSGTSTCGDIKCGICGSLYNEGEDDRGVYDNDSVTWTSFAGMVVCDCCFEDVEKEVLARMVDIIPWYRRILEKRMAIDRRAIRSLRDVENAESISKSVDGGGFKI